MAKDGIGDRCDNTNPTPADRAPLLALARELGVPVSSYAFIFTVARVGPTIAPCRR